MTESRAAPRIDRRLHALQTAKRCAAFGARVRTIAHLTGLQPRELLHLLFPDRYSVPRGRAPDSPEWYHGTNLLNRAEASIVIALYRRLVDRGVSAEDALLSAYAQYSGICQAPTRISFDRGFDLAAHTDGRWLTSTRSFSIVMCPSCHCEYLAAYGSLPRSNEDCPFCKLVQRYGIDQRIQAAFPAAPLPDGTGADLDALMYLVARPEGSS